MGCCCEWRAPRQLRFVLPTIVVSIIAWLYSSFTYFAQPRLSALGVHWTELLAFHVMTLLLCSSLAQCLLSTDSFVPKNTMPRKRLHQSQQRAPTTNDSSDDAPADTSSSDHSGTVTANPTSGSGTSASDGEDLDTLLNGMVECKMNGEIRYCRKCRAVKPDRAHHCSTCRRCVLKMDHHCVYINKCIGFYNYKYFLLFLGWSAATCLYLSSLLFRYLLADSLDHTAKLYVYGKLQLFSPSLQVLLVFFASFCLGAALLCFYVMHLYFTARNFSTVEYCEKRREPFYVNYFDLGVVRNVQEVFGTLRELPYWFVPVPSPSVVRTRGQRFPVNSKFAKED